jgi:putative FmdB family regulatory protein
MPTYEYECEKCRRTYEVRQRISDAPLEQCQYCEGRIHRLLSPAPFILKGGGWYVTDYPSESRKKAMAAERKTSEPSGSGKSDGGGAKSESKSEKSETKGESKSETKSESKSETKSEAGSSGSTSSGSSGSAGSGGGSGTAP